MHAVAIQVTDVTLTFDLSDGRSISVPLAWYPRLFAGTPAERANWRLIGRGEGVHWPDLDEDVSVDNLLSGARSAESPKSFKQWLAARATDQRSPLDVPGLALELTLDEIVDLVQKGSPPTDAPHSPRTPRADTP